MQKDEIIELMRETAPDRIEALLGEAGATRFNNVGDLVRVYGRIEFGNACRRNCHYCMLRTENSRLRRYRMSHDEIIRCASVAYSYGYRDLILESGENDKISAEWLGDIIKDIKDKYHLNIILCISERSMDEYRLWRDMGADAYLLKFETSDPELYRRIHPPLEPNEPDRIKIIEWLQKIGYKIGAGFMVGIPGQTYQTIAGDIELLRKIRPNLISINSYVPYQYTPLGRTFMLNKGAEDPDQTPNTDAAAAKAIALARLAAPGADIIAEQSVESEQSCDYSMAFRAGANCVIHNLTPILYRALTTKFDNAVFLSQDDVNGEIIRAIKSDGRTPWQPAGITKNESDAAGGRRFS